MNRLQRARKAIGEFARSLRPRRTIRSHRIEGNQTAFDPSRPPRSQRLRTTENRFNTYDSAVHELYKMYNNQADFGNGIARLVVDWRAGQIAGNGVNATSKDPATAEFLQQFVDRNQLAGSRFWEWVRDGELEGKAYIELVGRGDELKARMLPWHRFRYTVQVSDRDPDAVVEVSYTDAKGKIQQVANQDLFVFQKLSGITATDKGFVRNQTVPRTANAIRHMIDLDIALADLRDNNHLFAAPARIMQTGDEETADAIRFALFGDQSTKQNVEVDTDIGEWFILSAQTYYAEPSGAGVEALVKEVNLRAQVVSGETGIPVHYLGYAGLMTNRATAMDLHEMVSGTTSHEREQWVTTMTEVLRKAARLYQQHTGTALDPESIEVQIPVVMLSQVAQVKDVYLPLHQAGVISLEGLRERVPGIDPELEKQRIEAEKKSKQKQADELARDVMSRIQADDDGEEGGGDETTPPGDEEEAA